MILAKVQHFGAFFGAFLGPSFGVRSLHSGTATEGVTG
jgi:hypothetical protein